MKGAGVSAVRVGDRSADGLFDGGCQRSARVVIVGDFIGQASGEEAGSRLGASDAGGGEDIVLDVGRVGDAGDLLDDVAENDIAEIGVGVGGAGVVLEGLAEHVFDEELGGGGRGRSEGGGGDDGVGLGRIGSDRIVEPGGVLEQLLDGDGGVTGIDGGAGRRREAVEDGGEGLGGEAELALLDELIDAGGGDRLGVGGDAEEGVGLGELAGVDFGEPVATGEDQAAVDGDGEGGSGLLYWVM